MLNLERKKRFNHLQSPDEIFFQARIKENFEENP